MFYVYNLPRENDAQAISVPPVVDMNFDHDIKFNQVDEIEEADIDFVDDALLNTAPHNLIEKQLLRGDVVGLALMSSAIIWSAMGAFG